MMNQPVISPASRNPLGMNGVGVSGRYLAVSPDGKQVAVPKELFVAISDFLKTRKCSGSVTIDFDRDRIIGLEAVVKKRYSG